ncbi:hypothetical protein ES705_50463 [subsurface metagenome]
MISHQALLLLTVPGALRRFFPLQTSRYYRKENSIEPIRYLPGHTVFYLPASRIPGDKDGYLRFQVLFVYNDPTRGDGKGWQ